MSWRSDQAAAQARQAEWDADQARARPLEPPLPVPAIASPRYCAVNPKGGYVHNFVLKGRCIHCGIRRPVTP